MVEEMQSVEENQELNQTEIQLKEQKELECKSDDINTVTRIRSYSGSQNNVKMPNNFRIKNSKCNYC